MIFTIHFRGLSTPIFGSTPIIPKILHLYRFHAVTFSTGGLLYKFSHQVWIPSPPKKWVTSLQWPLTTNVNAMFQPPALASVTRAHPARWRRDVATAPGIRWVAPGVNCTRGMAGLIKGLLTIGFPYWRAYWGGGALRGRFGWLAIKQCSFLGARVGCKKLPMTRHHATKTAK